MPVEISLATASVRVSGSDLPISGHTLALALYLAAEGRPVARAQLASVLFRTESGSPESSVKVYVHRLRSVIGKESITRKAGGYAYSNRVSVDLPEIEEFVLKAEEGAPRSFAMRVRARRILMELSVGRPAVVLSWGWFSPIERRLRLVQRRLRAVCRLL